ncbi:hypothetical protein AXG94_08570 [Pseudomonas corrugata]|nr:hypothetical protein AXG94_08570 [Pseudomonas corrugata]
MIRNLTINMPVRLLITHLRFVRESNRANIQIETMPDRIAKMIRLVGFNCVFVPLRREQTFATDGFKTFSNTSDPSKKINKCKRRFMVQTLR